MKQRGATHGDGVRGVIGCPYSANAATLLRERLHGLCEMSHRHESSLLHDHRLTSTPSFTPTRFGPWHVVVATHQAATCSFDQMTEQTRERKACECCDVRPSGRLNTAAKAATEAGVAGPTVASPARRRIRLEGEPDPDACFPGSSKGSNTAGGEQHNTRQSTRPHHGVHPPAYALRIHSRR